MDDMQALADVVARAISTAQAPLMARIGALEKQLAKQPRDGRDGKDADMAAVTAVIAQHVRMAVDALPKPQDGAPGQPGEPGKDADVSVIADIVKAEVATAVAAVPVGRDGKDADVDTEMLDALVAQHVSKAFSDMTPAKDGTSVTVEDVAPLIQAEVAKAVSAIPVPKDGVGLTGALIDRDGHLVVTLTDGTAKDVGPVVGRDVDMDSVTKQIDATLASWPKPKDGADGIGFDDLSVEHNGERELTFRFMQGDRVKSFGPFTVAGVPIFRGTYAKGQSYERGDVVSWAGASWCAKEATSVEPGTGAPSAAVWGIVAMRGKQGTQGHKGLDGKPGLNGRDGQDLRYS